jgi:hypothetical protein
MIEARARAWISMASSSLGFSGGMLIKYYSEHLCGERNVARPFRLLAKQTHISSHCHAVFTIGA